MCDTISSRRAPWLLWNLPSAGQMVSCCSTPSRSASASWRSLNSRNSSTRPNRAWVRELFDLIVDQDNMLSHCTQRLKSERGRCQHHIRVMKQTTNIPAAGRTNRNSVFTAVCSLSLCSNSARRLSIVTFTHIPYLVGRPVLRRWCVNNTNSKLCVPQHHPAGLLSLSLCVCQFFRQCW